MSKKIIMTVLGAEAVGKTTLLATMYSQLARIGNPQTGFSIEAVGDTGVELAKAMGKLTTVIDQPNFSDSDRLLPGTAGISEHKFNVFFRNKKILNLSFYDHAGGIILEKEENADAQKFKKILSQADVVINVIDGAVLVKGSEPYSTKINNPTRTKELLSLTTQNNKPSLVLFVITKCESWLQNNEDKQKLRNAFEERHKVVVKRIQGQQNVAGIFIPVETLGYECMEFFRVTTNPEKILFLKKSGEFNPKEVEQPLLYALVFSMLRHLESFSWWKKTIAKGEYIAMKDALVKLRKEECNDKLKIYGNFTLLEI